MQDYLKRFFVLCSSEIRFSFLIKMSMLKAIEIETTFFIPLGIPRVARWIISYVLKIDTYINWLAEISTKNSRGIFDYWSDFSYCRVFQ